MPRATHKIATGGGRRGKGGHRGVHTERRHEAKGVRTSIAVAMGGAGGCLAVVCHRLGNSSRFPDLNIVQLRSWSDPEHLVDTTEF